MTRTTTLNAVTILPTICICDRPARLMTVGTPPLLIPDPLEVVVVVVDCEAACDPVPSVPLLTGTDPSFKMAVLVIAEKPTAGGENWKAV